MLHFYSVYCTVNTKIALVFGSKKLSVHIIIARVKNVESKNDYFDAAAVSVAVEDVGPKCPDR